MKSVYYRGAMRDNNIRRIGRYGRCVVAMVSGRGGECADMAYVVESAPTYRRYNMIARDSVAYVWLFLPADVV